MNSEQKQGMVLEIQRMSTEDGPGLRTTLFLKGCSLKCEWCHNPESISAHAEVQWLGAGCIGCDSCVRACNTKALSRTAAGIQIDRELCTGCGACTEACPSGAMEKIGTLWDAPALVYELAKDRAYFEKSGGGVTISGGEVAMQADFAREVLALLKQQGISTAIDTCGQCSWERLAQLLPHTDLVLYDLKEMDAAKHKEFVGVTNELVLGNLGRLFSLKKDRGYQGQIWIRTPVIPRSTARDENIVAAARLIQSLPVPPEKWELCAFNNLCRDKYTRLGLVWKYAGTGLLSRAEMEHLRKVAVAAGLPDELVVWSGTVTEAASEDKVS